MDQSYGSQEQLERVRQQAPDAVVRPYRMLSEATAQLHGLAAPERLVVTALEVIRKAVGGGPGVLLLRQEEGEQAHGFGSRELESDATTLASQVRPLTDKAMESGHAVVDGQGTSRGVAVPLVSGPRLVGALYVGPADLEARLGSGHLDILTLLGRHLAVAFDNSHHVRDLSIISAAGSEDAIPAGLSLRESKRLYERRLIRTRLREAKGNIASAARSLHMDRGQLSRLLKKHGIDKSQYRQGR